MPPPRDRASFTSLELIRLARSGDKAALDELFDRQVGPLRRWAAGRLPRWARSATETADLVQDVLLNTFRRLDHIELRRKGALQAYLRQSIHHRIHDELRLSGRRPRHDPADSSLVDPAVSPLEEILQREDHQRYLAALARLDPRDQELIVGRLELGYSYEQLAVATARRGAEAARVAARRAVMRLVDEMKAD